MPPKSGKKNPARSRAKPKPLDEVVPPPSPPRKRKTQPKKKSGTHESGSESEGENKLEEAENRIEYALDSHLQMKLCLIKLHCSWTDELCLLMIAEITNSEIIKQGLFPAPGTKAAPSNKTGKNDYRWELCVAVFSEHPEYTDVFVEVAKNPERKKSWTLKMKNKLAASVHLFLGLYSFTHSP